MRLKNRTAFNAEMLKMNEQTYNLRRKVINILYELKSEGYRLPRIQVRIVKNADAMAYAYNGQNIIHVDEYWINYSNLKLLVMHEVGHAVFGLEKIDGCDLMDCNRNWDKIGDTAETVAPTFKKYYTEYASKLN